MRLRRRWVYGLRGTLVVGATALTLVAAGTLSEALPAVAAVDAAAPESISPNDVPQLDSPAPQSLSAPVEVGTFEPPTFPAPEAKLTPKDNERSFDEKSSTVVERTEDSTIYENADGTYTTALTAEPSNVLTADGSWKPVSTQIAAVDGGGGQITRHPLSPKFAASADSADLLRMDRNGAEVTISLVGARPEALTRDGSVAEYEDVLPGADLTYEVTPGAVKESGCRSARRWTRGTRNRSSSQTRSARSTSRPTRTRRPRG